MALDRVLTIGELLERLPFSRQEIWRRVRRGEFPAPLKLGARRIGWRENEVEAWLDSQKVVEYAPTEEK